MSLNGDLRQEPSLETCASGRHSNSAPTWLTTAVIEWNALHVILAPGDWQALSLSIRQSLILTRGEPAEETEERQKLLTQHFRR